MLVKEFEDMPVMEKCGYSLNDVGYSKFSKVISIVMSFHIVAN